MSASAESLEKMLGFIAKDLGLDISQTSNPVTITRMIRCEVALRVALKDELLEALRHRCHWFDTCTRTNAPNWEERAAAAIDRLDAAIAAMEGK